MTPQAHFLRDRDRFAKPALRAAAHLLFGTRRWARRNLEDLARGMAGKRILEVGSGRHDLGQDAFSFKAVFDPSNEFVQSDVVPEYGHEIVDIRTMSFEEEFDVILCLYVLEHILELEDAVRNMHRALTPGGILVIAVPHLYPYHDEPTDYWRFTEHALRRMLADFGTVQIKIRGFRRMPLALMAIATKQGGA
jgi:SAM-dependent methyltransferase